MNRIIIVSSILLLILSILGGIFLWWPNLQNFLGLKEEVKTLDIKLIEKKEYFAKLDIVSDKLKKYPDELTKIDSALAIDPSMPALFDFIRKASSESGLAIKHLSLDKISLSAGDSKIKEISFTLSLSGTYSAFRNFLSTVYKSSRMIETSSITFSSPLENDLFEFNLKMTTYSYLSRGGALVGER